MSKNRKKKLPFKPSQPKGNKKTSQQKEVEALLNAPRTKHAKMEKLLYDEFHDLEYQRLAKMELLKQAITKKCRAKFKFSNWTRCVSFKYSNNPLSSRGSVKSIGGRFNVGEDINEMHFTPFNALYFAEDQATAMIEKFAVPTGETTDKGLLFCLGKNENFTVTNLSGELHNVLDIDKAGALTEFVSQIKTVQYSNEIQKRRKQEGLSGVETLQTVKSLKDSLYDIDWRYNPMVNDLPANCQIFGQIAFYAGVEGILYTSTKTNKKCLAVFPKNLSEKSYIELSGPIPETIEVTRLNINSYEKCI